MKKWKNVILTPPPAYDAHVCLRPFVSGKTPEKTDGPRGYVIEKIFIKKKKKAVTHVYIYINEKINRRLYRVLHVFFS